MMKSFSLSLLATLPYLIAPAIADGPFYGDPPDANHPWGVHDHNRPQPKRVVAGTFSSQETPGKPPSDAVVLFDGTEASMSNWQPDGKPKDDKRWAFVDGALQCTPGAGTIRTTEEFGECQLHIEWSAPTEVKGNSQGRGNSGVFFMGEFEVQVLDNYNNPSYADGMAGSIYGVNPPMANSLRAPGEWQMYDIVFRRPIYKDGKEIDPGHVTVFINGVLVQDSTPLEGGGGHRGRSKSRSFKEKGALQLQDHGNTTRFRNIWYRPLPKRSIEGGTDGRLTEAAAIAKRQEIAASIRKDAASKEGNDKMYRLFESLCYAPHAESLNAATAMSAAYVADLKGADKDALEKRKGEIMQARQAYNYLVQHQFVPAEFAAKPAVEAIIEAAGWNKKKR
jgi:hypothetical protein